MAGIPKGRDAFFRLSPAVDKPECYALRRGEIEGRVSAEYYRAEYRALFSELRHAYPGIRGLGNYTEVICGPFGTEITKADYARSGVPLLRISDITDEGTLDLSGVMFISRETESKTAGRVEGSRARFGKLEFRGDQCGR